jgi:hypothetical protein
MNGTNHHKPDFTADELRAIHRELATVPWQHEVLYEPRRAVIRKLDSYFGEERSHLRIMTR